MSAENQRGPAIKRAGRAVIALDGVNIGDLGINHGGVVAALLEGQLAIAEETARLADEQRTANLLALLQIEGYDVTRSADQTSDVRAEVRTRLGLDT